MEKSELSEAPFLEFILYNNWANGQVMRACQNLSEEQLAAAAPGAYGTIRDTLEHIIRSQAHYVRLVKGAFPQPPFEWGSRPDFAAMTAYAAQVDQALVDIAQHVRPTDTVNEEYEGKLFHYNALAVFIQIINHGVEHRTNITTLLNQGLHTTQGLQTTQGQQTPPPEVDGWAYLNAYPGRFELR